MSAGDFDLPSPAASERAVIGAVILSGGAVLDELTLVPDDFVATGFAVAYGVMLELHRVGKLIDQFTVFDAVPQQYRGVVLEAADSVYTDANVSYYAEIVAAASLRRRLAAAGQGIIQLSSDGEPHALVDDARALLDRMAGMPTDRAVPTMHEVFDDWQVEMTEVVESTPTPWPELSARLGGGMTGSRFYVIGARPGIGKSAIALQLAHELAQRGRVLFASLEMPRNEVLARIVAQQTQVPLARILRRYDLSDFMHERIAVFRANDPMNIAVDDDAAQTVFDIRNKARSMHRTGNLTGVVIDYLQLMQDPRDLARHEKVAEMTRALKLLSRELDVPVIALSQLNRESTRRSDGTPSLADLRESGSIEQDADVVLLLDRNVEEGAEDDELTVILAKNRQGAPGSVYVRWEGEFVRATSR